MSVDPAPSPEEAAFNELRQVLSEPFNEHSIKRLRAVIQFIAPSEEERRRQAEQVRKIKEVFLKRKG